MSGGGVRMVLWGSILALVAFALAYGTGRLLMARAAELGLVALPNGRSSHVAPTPTGGGVGIALGGTLAALPSLASLPQVVVPMLVAGLGMAMLGFADDRKPLAARWRLGGQIVFVGIALAMLPLGGIAQSLGLPLPDWALLAGLVLWGALWVNLYNFMDGIDGLAAGEAVTVLFGAVVLCVVAVPEAMTHPLLWWMAGVGAAGAGFLLLNLPPARLFMGDTGSTYLGLTLFLLAILTIAIGWLTPVQWLLLVGAFLADSLVTLVRRVLRGEPAWRAHRQHAYQHLARRFGHGPVSLGFSAVNVVVLLPLAWAAGVMPIVGPALAAFALLALGGVALALGAGRASGEQGDEVGAQPDDGE